MIRVETPLVVDRWLQANASVPSSPDTASSWRITDSLYTSRWETADGGSWNTPSACLTVALSNIRGWQLRANTDGSLFRFRTIHTGQTNGMSPWRDIYHSGMTGVIPTERLGTGTRNSTTALHGDGVFRVPGTALDKFVENLTANGVQTVFTVTHNLGTKDILLQFHHRAGIGLNSGSYDIHYGPNVMFAPVVEHLNANQISLTFGTAPQDKEWRIIAVKP